MWEVFVYLYVQHHTFETFEFSTSNCISGMGVRIVMEWKGRESTAFMVWCKTQPLCDSRGGEYG